jgi:hypothetical protein
MFWIKNFTVDAGLHGTELILNHFCTGAEQSSKDEYLTVLLCFFSLNECRVLHVSLVNLLS